MRMLRAVYVATGRKDCNACGRPKEGPCEMYEYIDSDGGKVVVCFDCRAFCTPDRTAQSFRDRNLTPLT